MATSPRRKKRPSKAAVARLRADVEARPKGRTLPPELAAVIDAYTPLNASRVPMDTIRPFLHAAITASTLTGEESVRKHCNHLTQLAAFAIGRGVPLEVHRLLTTAFIDEYIRVGMTGDSDGVRAQRRTRLLALATAANPGPDAPAKLAPIGYSAIKPSYSPTDMSVIRRAALVQPTPGRQRDLAIVVAGGAGAGLDSIDFRRLRTTDVEDMGGDGILIHVQEPRPRIVPVRLPYEQMLRDALAQLGPDQLLLGHKEDRRNTAARATERAALHKIPHIEPARLRATWLADLMTDRVPLAVILQAAGLKSARSLSELQPHLGPWLEHKGLTLDDGNDVTGSDGIDVLRGEVR